LKEASTHGVLISTKGAECNSLGQRTRQPAGKFRSAEGAT